MLLRSISRHVKDQNWLVVLVDFAIVFFGVFVGLQAQDWSNARQLDQQERDYLVELAAEIRLNNDITEYRLDMMTLVIESGERALEFLTEDQPCETECWPLLVDFFTASQVMFSPVSTTVYDEMQRLGLVRTESVKLALFDYYVRSTTVYSSFDSGPAYRLHIRELISLSAQRALWGGCHNLDAEGMEIMIPDCPPGIPEKETNALLELFRADSSLSGQLNYWVGMHTMWTPQLPQVVEQGEEVLRAIDAAIAES
jgi:hypothetical protein